MVEHTLLCRRRRWVGWTAGCNTPGCGWLCRHTWKEVQSRRGSWQTPQLSHRQRCGAARWQHPTAIQQASTEGALRKGLPGRHEGRQTGWRLTSKPEELQAGHVISGGSKGSGGQVQKRQFNGELWRHSGTAAVVRAIQTAAAGSSSAVHGQPHTSARPAHAHHIPGCRAATQAVTAGGLRPMQAWPLHRCGFPCTGNLNPHLLTPTPPHATERIHTAIPTTPTVSQAAGYARHSFHCSTPVDSSTHRPSMAVVTAEMPRASPATHRHTAAACGAGGRRSARAVVVVWEDKLVVGVGVEPTQASACSWIWNGRGGHTILGPAQLVYPGAATRSEHTSAGAPA